MTFSIVIATYGSDHWRRLGDNRALPSAAAQFPHDIIRVHQPDGNIATARNEGAEQATGDWLVFLDADDELAPGYLKAMFDAWVIHHPDEPMLLTPNVRQVNGRARHRQPSFYPEVPLDSGNWLVIGTALQRDLFWRAGGFDNHPHGFEDWALWAKCWKLGAVVVKVPDAVYVQYINPRSKHRLGWRDRRWQVATHMQVQKAIEEWQPA